MSSVLLLARGLASGTGSAHSHVDRTFKHSITALSLCYSVSPLSQRPISTHSSPPPQLSCYPPSATQSFAPRRVQLFSLKILQKCTSFSSSLNESVLFGIVLQSISDIASRQSCIAFDIVFQALHEKHNLSRFNTFASASFTSKCFDP